MPAKLCRVTPSILHAASPVEAVTAIRSGSFLYLSRSFLMISLMRTDLPVPAEPVKKILFPLSTTALNTWRCSSLRNIGATCVRGACFLELDCVFWACVFLYCCRSSFCSSLIALAVLFHGAVEDGRAGVFGFVLSSITITVFSCFRHGTVRGAAGV
ncbi:hypothetical protein BJX76DRAFT_333191 [Aspergillus varians]